MTPLTAADTANVLTLIQAMRDNLDRIEAILSPVSSPSEEDELAKLDPGSPLNKSGKFLSWRGIEVCYCLYDMGKSRYDVAKLMNVTYPTANNRYLQWENMGGKDRERKPADWPGWTGGV